MTNYCPFQDGGFRFCCWSGSAEEQFKMSRAVRRGQERLWLLWTGPWQGLETGSLIVLQRSKISTNTGLVLLLLSVLVESWALNILQTFTLVCWLCWVNSSCLIVFLVCCPSSNKRKSMAVFPNPKYCCMGDITGCSLVALAAHSCSGFFGGSFPGGADGAPEEGTNGHQTKGCQKLKLPNSHFCLEMQTAVGNSFWSCPPGYSLYQPHNSTALMIDLFCLSFLWIKGASSAQKEQRLKMGRFESYRWHWGEELLGADCVRRQNMRH